MTAELALPGGGTFGCWRGNGIYAAACSRKATENIRRAIGSAAAVVADTTAE